jgi:hypothetical protein
MAKLNIEKPLTKAVQQLVDEMEKGGEVTMTERIGTIKLDNGLEAQVHVVVTTEVDDFLELTS